MTNEKYNENQEFEKLLREKMDQLSDSVDCFDKISARAFPEKSSDFSDSELFVSDLENVTGKRRGAVFLRWTAAAAAIVLCVGVLPKTAIMNNFLANIGKNRNELYSSMISEIESETQLNDYRQYDVTLSEYLADDFLITPLYSCPFEDVDREDMRVRIFIRENDGLLTNQVYAVEYSGDYTESNFIAVAESEAKFTDEELADFDSGNAEYTDAVEKLRSAVEEMTKENGYSTLDLKKYTGDGTNSDMAASFSYETLIREGEQIYPIAVYALYHNSHENGGIKYYYDFSCYKYENDEPVPAKLSDEAFKWRNAVGFDGCQITPKQSGSRFERKEVLSAVSDISLCAWVVPLENYDGESGAMPLTLAEESTYGFSTLGSVDMPYDNIIRKTAKVYIDYKSGTDQYILAKGNDFETERQIQTNESTYTESQAEELSRLQEEQGQLEDEMEKEALESTYTERQAEELSRLQEEQRQLEAEIEKKVLEGSYISGESAVP